ncbi:hypothetical protein [Streptomyces albidus (ex Kaewkla and Franco 2022)]|uniref:hypothetical protein n=1 Tax=Streptomyces albidus (ex Kaewkla and Franco 2022) TaxID=722709 RepID=UPI0015EE5D31|nr:hypothetical protein [Streptomyces albidus (ex Kaewkla and Franco 2022)]
MNVSTGAAGTGACAAAADMEKAEVAKETGWLRCQRHRLKRSRSQAGNNPSVARKNRDPKTASNHLGVVLGSVFVAKASAAVTPQPTVIQNIQSRYSGASYRRSTALSRFGRGNGGADCESPM